MRKRPTFVPGEIYHIYNRGVDKREIFSSEEDIVRFIIGMDLFNTKKPIGSIYETGFNLKKPKKQKITDPLVEIIAYCLNPNHYHLLVKEKEENGVSEFMKRIGGGYAGYYNNKYGRSGTLFQGRFKASHVNTNEYLLHVSVYVNLNYRAHQLGELGGPTPKFVQSKSSWGEYSSDSSDEKHCSGTDVILEQFKDKKQYATFAEDAIIGIIQRKQKEKELKKMLLE